MELKNKSNMYCQIKNFSLLAALLTFKNYVI
nr:MAG TPA: hypothetical protein [Caudoviricetes sp.]